MIEPAPGSLHRHADALAAFGWRPFFELQLDHQADASLLPARVMSVSRNRVQVRGPELGSALSIPMGHGIASIDRPTVGDWVLLDMTGPSLSRTLDRIGVFKRVAPRSNGQIQLIAANVDTLFIVTSADRDFSVARLERYLSVARDGAATPVVVITKADITDQAQRMQREASSLAIDLAVEVVDARLPDATIALAPWCGLGQTVALVGSSGVGKSTLVNTLAGASESVGTVRASDGRGRHTTTGRSMHRMMHGGWLVDTPGMRELQLVDVAQALDDVFADVSLLARQCQFSDCRHATEPECAVRHAVAEGKLDTDRLERFLKLADEDRLNTRKVEQMRARGSAAGKSSRAGRRRKSDRGG